MKSKTFKYYLKLLINSFFRTKNENYFLPSYRVVEIFQNNEDEYVAEIQIINKNITFKAKPEEILSRDKLIDQFSPRDIRTLTYLGYLGINSPKYRILAKKLSEEDDKLIFALKKKGANKVIVKTAEQIINEKNIIENLTSKDAKLIGYTVASESITKEQRLKSELIKNKEKDMMK